MAGDVPWSFGLDLMKRADRGELDRASDAEKTRLIDDFVRGCSRAAAALALQPVPGVDPLLLHPAHDRMTRVISRVRGTGDPRRARDRVWSHVGGKIVGLYVLMTMAKVVPFADVFAAAIAYGLTRALGEVTDAALQDGDGLDKRRMTALFDSAYKRAYADEVGQAQKELRALFRKPETRRCIDDLRKRERTGALAPGEAERRMEELLRSG